MRFRFTEKALKQYASLPASVQKRFDKQLSFLLSDLTYPSIHAKKYDESRAIWQGRVTRDFRFYFHIERDTYVILAITKHPK
jgi:mRNA-degrading endonuclease RelE of RelBE toxin-antitoxin system